MTLTPFNLNDYVLVRITEAGHALLRKQHDELRQTFPNLHSYTPPKEIDGGWTRYQMWDFANRFGPAMYNGSHPVVMTDILIEVDA